MVGGWKTILKNINQWEGLFPIYGKMKKCSKAPTSNFNGTYQKLVGGAIIILKNMSSSMGRIIPIYYGNIKNVPKHQPVILIRAIKKNIYIYIHAKICDIDPHEGCRYRAASIIGPRATQNGILHYRVTKVGITHSCCYTSWPCPLDDLFYF